VKRQASSVPAQTPQVFQALDILRGSEPLSATQIQQVLAYAYPGSSYPTYSYIPQTSFNCNQVRQFGFYADPETRCQVGRKIFEPYGNRINDVKCAKNVTRISGEQTYLLLRHFSLQSLPLTQDRAIDRLID
jgi:hypothetical protein